MIDLKTLFAETLKIRVRYGDHELLFQLREPSTDEYLVYRHECGNVRVRDGKMETSSVALNAPLKLFDVICERVILEDGAGEEQVLEDFKTAIPAAVKLAVIDGWQTRLTVVKTKD